MSINVYASNVLKYMVVAALVHSTTHYYTELNIVKVFSVLLIEPQHRRRDVLSATKEVILLHKLEWLITNVCLAKKPVLIIKASDDLTLSRLHFTFLPLKLKLPLCYFCTGKICLSYL